MELMSQLLLPLGPYPLVLRDDSLPPLWGKPWREPVTLLPPTMSASPKEDEMTLQVVPLPSGPAKAIAGPLGSSTLPMELQKELPVPCHIPELVLPAKAFIWVNLEGSGIVYLCEQQKYLTLGLYGVPLPPGTLRGLSSLSLLGKLFKSLKFPSPWQGDP